MQLCREYRWRHGLAVRASPGGVPNRARELSALRNSCGKHNALCCCASVCQTGGAMMPLVDSLAFLKGDNESLTRNRKNHA